MRRRMPLPLWWNTALRITALFSTLLIIVPFVIAMLSLPAIVIVVEMHRFLGVGGSVCAFAVAVLLLRFSWRRI